MSGTVAVSASSHAGCLRAHLGIPGKRSYVQQFAEAYGLNPALNDDGSLTAEEPAALASFVAFSKGQKGKRVYLRGQDCWRGGLTPLLFRDAVTDEERRSRWRAYQAFCDRLKKIVPGARRIRRRNFGAVLQHYGFRTPWLDVVDDIHAAVWFATHNRCDLGDTVRYQRASEGFGCVVVLAVPKDIRVQDLRAAHSSRNTRCHVQQAFSLAMQNDDAVDPSVQQDFSTYVLGVVRIPTVKRWHLRGFRASQSYFFPSVDIDSTYKRLLAPEVNELADRTESEFGVPGALGHAAEYSDEMEES